MTEITTKPEEVQAYLDAVQLKTELSSHEKQQVLALMSQPGFALVLGLLLAERQGCFIQTLNISGGDEDSWRRLGVLQGTVRGIDRTHMVLLECASVPTD